MTGCENKEDFGEYAELVDAWCIKHEMIWVNPDFIKLFDSIKNMDIKEVER